MKRKAVSGDEQDVVSSWRRYYRYLQRPGATSRIKRQMRRRERHDARRELGQDGDR